MKDKRVVITGMGVISPIGNTVGNFWDSAVNGRSGIETIKRFDASAFDSRIAGEVLDFDPLQYITAKELKRTTRFCQFAIASAKEAIAHSGLELEKEDPYRIGVYVGSGIGGLDVIQEQYDVLLNKGPRRMSVFTIPMLIINMAPAQVAIKFGLKGPNISIATACATGTHAVGEAYYVLQQGEADVMLAGGTEACIVSTGIGGFCACKALSKRNDEPQRASRPFDKERDGFVMAEGAGILVLETLDHALKRNATICAEVVGFAANDDAFHQTAPAPEGAVGAECMKMALKSAKMNPEDISYINAHGTSTSLNDKYETMAIKKVFGEHAYKVPISSTKSMTGHLLGAAGSVELIAAVKAINEGVIHPTINYENPDPECDLDYVPNTARETNVETALSNSLGFGGHNGVVIVKKFKG